MKSFLQSLAARGRLCSGHIWKGCNVLVLICVSFLVDKVFEPIMALQTFDSLLVRLFGSGKESELEKQNQWKLLENEKSKTKYEITGRV